jgi:hypothetical protein
MAACCQIASSHIFGNSRNGEKSHNSLPDDDVIAGHPNHWGLGTGLDVRTADRAMMIQVFMNALTPHLTPRKVRLALLTLATFAALC